MSKTNKKLEGRGVLRFLGNNVIMVCMLLLIVVIAIMEPKFMPAGWPWF